MSVYLLDANVLISLAWPHHVHHANAHTWFHGTGRAAWATCPLTQIAFIRISSNAKIIADAVTPREALEVLKKIVEVPSHHFWPDTVAPTDAKTFTSAAFVGHRQVTDAYLLSLAQHHKGKLATFDKGIAELVQANNERRQHITVIEA
ncbi:MAG TPA: TA system VapC family ribonuclease toxin [Steroidobacteraceae bacterium]